MKITIAGDLGSGKSTIGRALADQWGYDFYSTGDIFRKLSAEKGLDILAGNKMGENDRSFDDEVDNYSKSIGETQENFLFDSRLAWHFIPDSISIYFYCDSKVAAERIYKAQRKDERSSDVEEMVRINKERRLSEINRYKELYGLDILNLTNYDLVIDTTYYPADTLVEWLMAAIQKGRKGVYLSHETLEAAKHLDEKPNPMNIMADYNIEGWKVDKFGLQRCNPAQGFVQVSLI